MLLYTDYSPYDTNYDPNSIDFENIPQSQNQQNIPNVMVYRDYERMFRNFERNREQRKTMDNVSTDSEDDDN